MTRPDTDSLLASLATADPLHNPVAAGPEDDENVRRARAIYDVRISAGGGRRGWRQVRPPRHPARRLATVCLAAVALPVAAAVIAPEVTARLGRDPERVPLASIAFADDGTTSCGGGTYTHAIRPDSSDLRLWPAVLPAGWKVRVIFARRTAVKPCAPVSLVASRTGADGLVTGSVEIVGPAASVRVGYGSPAVEDTVNGLHAQRYDLSASNPNSFAWLVTDATGSFWHVRVGGYPFEQARAVVQAATFHSGQVDWDASRAGGLRVLFHRDRAPFKPLGHSSMWVIRVDTPRGERDIVVTTSDAPFSYGAGVGSRPLTKGGRAFIVMLNQGRPTGLFAEVGPRAAAVMDVNGDLDAAETVLASLEPIDANDPRLDRYALREQYK